MVHWQAGLGLQMVDEIGGLWQATPDAGQEKALMPAVTQDQPVLVRAYLAHQIGLIGEAHGARMA